MKIAEVSTSTAEQVEDPCSKWYVEHTPSHPDKFVIVVSCEGDGTVIHTRSTCSIETIEDLLAKAHSQFAMAVARKRKDALPAGKLN